MGPAKYSVLLVVGFLFVIGGLVGFFVIKAQVKRAVLETMVIDSADHKDFEDWLSPYDEDDTPFLQRVFLFNLTNPGEFFAGLAPPNFTEIGPFVYRYYEEKFDAVFTEGGARVNYSSRDVYVFQPQYSAYDSDSDMLITGVNPYYVGLVNAIGGEANLPFVLGAGALAGTFNSPATLVAWGNSTTGPCLPPPLSSVCGFASATGGSLPLSPTQSIGVFLSLVDPIKFATLAAVAPVLANSSATPAEVAGALAALQLHQVNASWAGLPVEVYGVPLVMYMQQVMTAVSTFVNTAFATEYGLLIRRTTPRDFIFSHDPLLAFLGQTGRFYANTSTAEYTLRTGKDDEKYAGMNFFIRHRGQEYVTVYEEPFPIASRTRSIDPFGGVAPDHLEVYFSPAQRHLPALYTGVQQIKRIETAIYTFDAERIVRASAFFKSPIDGFVSLVPITGVPLFFSVPHMWHTPAEFSALVSGMRQDQRYDSRLFIEEFTGIALRGERQLQINVLLNYSLHNYTNHVPQSAAIFIPLFYDIEFAEIGDEAARSLRKAVVDAVVAQKAILGVFVGVGIALILVGATLMVQLTSGTKAQDGDTSGGDAAAAKGAPKEAAGGEEDGVTDLPADDGVFVVSQKGEDDVTKSEGAGADSELAVVGPR